jgi:GT2 family glycosyltransferase
MPHPELSIVVVNWNTRDLLRRCIESIAKANIPIQFEVVIVDNASQDESLALIHESPSAQSLLAKQQLTIIENSENLGFGRANNQAFSLTKSPFVFLLNPDAQVEPYAIEQLLETIRSNGGIGACGPRILNADGSIQTSVYFSPPSAWHTFFWQLKLYRMLPGKLRGEILLGRHWTHNRRRDVPMLIGAALLVRREVIDQVGGFDEQFEMYSEDHEWCWRMRKAGWRVVFDPSATVTHHGGVSATKRWSNEEKLRVRLDSGFRFEQLALSRLKLIANQLANYVVVSTQIAGRQITGGEIGDLRLIKKIHTEHLKRALKREHRGEPSSDPAHRGVSV